MKYEEILEYTPRELYYYFLARMLDKDEQLQLVAWQTAIIVSYTNRLKKPIKPRDLYRSPRTRREFDPEKLKKEFYEILKKHENHSRKVNKGGENNA